MLCDEWKWPNYFTWERHNVMNFVCVCVLGEFQSPNHDPRIYFIVRDIKLSIHQKHPFCRLNGKFNLVTDWFNIVDLWYNR